MSQGLTIVSLILLSLFSLVLASPIDLHSRGSLHACAVYVQRWYDNSMDIYGYNYDYKDDPSGPANFMGTESTALSPGQSISGIMGSQAMVVTDIANPAVINDQTNWNDPGQLSFTWGSTSFSSTSSQCTVVAVGNAGNLQGGATTTTCSFSCDA